MPLYEYTCTSCAENFERRLSMSNHSEPEEQPCPACGLENTIKQAISTFALGDPIRLGITRPDSGFGEVMDRIKKSHPRSSMATNHQSKYGKTGVV